MRAQSGTQKDFPDMQHSLLSHLFLQQNFLYYEEIYTCIHTLYMHMCGCVKVQRLYMFIITINLCCK
jgi:hypothetical protein